MQPTQGPALEDRLNLDAPVTRWLPNFRPPLPDGSTQDLSIRHLLTHMSGLGYAFLEPADRPYHKLNISDGLDQPGLSLEENLIRLSAASLSFAPGESWRYSVGMDVLSGVLEKIEDRSLSEIVREKVTAPLGIDDTNFLVSDPYRLDKAYADGDPLPVPMTEGIAVPPHTQSYPSGGAGMAGMAGDILRFLEAIRTGGTPIMKPETVEMMVKHHVGTKAET